MVHSQALGITVPGSNALDVKLIGWRPDTRCATVGLRLSWAARDRLARALRSPATSAAYTRTNVITIRTVLINIVIRVA